ncbi:thiamine pyrophosphate-dependent dehydrogenase E1 component subunit alpha [Desulfopila sp. IMCC35008]|uniref:thiamine pyrophosphate-dependent dehydrogenase E1 component subunit alpha n=1 Tax=Desulfopila sp. IMCC35008 TaxID=2653858 RepID=UPI0013D64903|nr:thiamine pyrophosphate-dependent dehydrogenase E1 component subunit alpha [Desulfopila sp. IMCC35008]
MKISKEKLLELYTTLVKCRLFEERIVDLYARGQVPGLAHLYIGEEAMAAGVCGALRDDDYITSTHRGHGHVVAKGAGLDRMMAELYGKQSGYCKGKGGSMHIADMALGILGANGIAGGGLPLAVGAGWSAKWRKTDQVTACFFGDAASNNGTFHESLNLAAVHKLPVIFVCENNLYGISVAQEKHQVITDVSVRADGYGMPGVTIDGMDVTEVYKTTVEAVERARAGEGPTLIEGKTYRFRGHHEGDPNQGARYRDKSEIEIWKEKCPIVRLGKQLVKSKVATRKKLDQIHQKIEQDLDHAVQFAEQAEFPPIEDMYTDIFATEEVE